MILCNSLICGCLIDFLISVNKDAILKPVETMLQQVPVFLSNLYIPHKTGVSEIMRKCAIPF